MSKGILSLCQVGFGGLYGCRVEQMKESGWWNVATWTLSRSLVQKQKTDPRNCTIILGRLLPVTRLLTGRSERSTQNEDVGQVPKDLRKQLHPRGLCYGVRRETSSIEPNGPFERRLSPLGWHGRCCCLQCLLFRRPWA